MKLFANKRELLAKVMCRLHLPSVLHRFGNDRITILNYHRIYKDSESLNSVSFDADVYSCSESQFVEHVEHLQSLGRILSFDEFLYWLDKGTGPKEHCTLLTFDDAYVDNYDIAFPILKSHDASACFFVPTESVEDRHLGWWDIISFLVKKTDKDRVSIRRPLELELNIEQLGEEEAIRAILRQFKTEIRINTDDVLAALSAACEVEIPGDGLQSDQLMTIDNLVEMQSAGMEIGGHGHSHKILGQLDERGQRNEIARCTEMLRQWVGTEVRAFAYPVGLAGCYTDTTKSLVREFGYKVAFNFIENARSARFDMGEKYDIDRLAVYRPTKEQFELLAHGWRM